MPVRPILRETKIKKYGSPVYEYVFPRGRYTKANIRKALSDLQKQLSGRPSNDNIKSVTSIRAPINKKEKRLLSAKDYKAEVATNLDFGWRTAKWFELNGEPIVNDFYDLRNQLHDFPLQANQSHWGALWLRPCKRLSEAGSK